jgi:hypothetical protein
MNKEHALRRAVAAEATSTAQHLGILVFLEVRAGTWPTDLEVREQMSVAQGLQALMR